MIDFIHKYWRKKVDFDGFYGGQCVDLVRQYIQEVLKQKQPPKIPGAGDWWKYEWEGFVKIPNTPSGIPNPGDVMIWNKNVGNGSGHTAVFVAGDVNRFVSFDQNWPTLSVCTLTEHDYKNILGWFHPVAHGSLSDTEKINKIKEIIND